MGMLDQELVLSENQPVTATGDTASTNVYNTGGANGQGDSGQTGENLWVNVVVRNLATGGGTIQAVLQDSANNSSFADVLAGPAVTGAGITTGLTLLQVQPPVGMRQYWRVVYRVTTSVLTGSPAFDAYVSNTIQRNISRPSGIPAVQ